MRTVLIALLIAVCMISGGTPSASTAERMPCGTSSPMGNCDVNNGDDDVNLGGWVNDGNNPDPPTGNDGNEGNGGGGGSGGGGGGTGGGGGAGDGSDEGGVWWCPDNGESPLPPECVWIEDDDDDPDNETEDPLPPTVVTSTEVISFAPPAPTVTSEPKGVAIVGMPMNVVVPTEATSSSGSLLGFPVRVSFTPEQLEIDYGDGSSATTAADAGSWGSLDQAQFTATETSHAYAARGRYTITVRVLYSATVEFIGYGTVPVSGLVSSSAATTSVRAVTVDTGLVDETCAENPTGPGC